MKINTNYGDFGVSQVTQLEEPELILIDDFESGLQDIELRGPAPNSITESATIESEVSEIDERVIDIQLIAAPTPRHRAIVFTGTPEDRVLSINHTNQSNSLTTVSYSTPDQRNGYKPPSF